jgi:hypothetical protein
MSLLGKIINFCNKNKNLLFTFDEILKDSNFENESRKDILRTIETAECFFYINKEKDPKIFIDFDLGICDYYSEPNGCGSKCYKLHLCKNVLKSKSCDKMTCKLDHEITSSFNTALFKKKGISTDFGEILDFYKVNSYNKKYFGPFISNYIFYLDILLCKKS